MSTEIDPGVLLGRRRLHVVGLFFALALLVLGLRLVDLALLSGEPVM